MTVYPCLVDTPTVEQLIDEAGYQANMVLDPAANALAFNGRALSAPVGPCDSARVYRTANQTMSSGDFVSFAAQAVRWDTTNGRIFSGATGFTLSRTGWWAIGATLAFAPGATVQFAQALLLATSLAGINQVIGADGAGSPGTFSASTAEQIALNPNGFAYLPSGTTIGVQVFIGGSAGTITLLSGPTYPTVAAGVEAASSELWGTCYEALVIT